MADGDVLLAVAHVAQRLGGNQILEDVSFQVRDRVRPGAVTGQVVGLLGPSGVGKTRLLRLLAGLDAPDRGTIKGKDGAPIVPGTVGLVFQNYPLLRHRRVLGNLVTGGVAAGLSRAEAQHRSRALLERFGLTGRASFYPAQLSGGQRQRAAIAQQLVRRPALVLFDEPFSGLDPAALDATIRLLIEIAHMDEHNTLLLVTHDIRAAMVCCDTLLMLGRDRDPQGNIVSGARILHTYDLVAAGLAWRDDVDELPAFVPLEREIRSRFATL